MNRYFDTHVHFDGIVAPDGLDGVLERATAAGVSRMLAIGGDAERNRCAVELARAHAGTIRAVVGYDRDCAGFPCPADELAALTRPSHPIAAIGEIGLDYHYHAETKDAQRELLGEMLDLARRRRLPVVIHSREAEDDTIGLLADHVAAGGDVMDGRIGVLHCFTGNAAFARRLLDLDFYISFSGIVTFRNADSIREAASFVPADRLLIETDSPYLAPVPCRGVSNEPALVPHVADMLAKVRGVGVGAIAETTFRNACRLFQWPE